LIADHHHHHHHHHLLLLLLLLLHGLRHFMSVSGLNVKHYDNEILF
jgi:hypothetical protein